MVTEGVVQISLGNDKIGADSALRAFWSALSGCVILGPLEGLQFRFG
jgi:hypothetical protein